MRKVLDKAFFARPTKTVARELLGKYLVRKYKGKEIAVMLTEVEVYDGFKDKASQASRGKTERNKIMFGEAGTIYVYFTYGMHWMFNIITSKKDYPSAVLIRGSDKVIGPARLTKFLKIDKSLNDKKLGKANGLWIEDRGVISRKSKVESRKWKIRKTPRIGIPRAEEWVHKPLRFVLEEIK